MSLTLSYNTLAIGPLMKARFLGIGGVPAYTYAVLPGGIGGTINPSGVYTAPATIGADTIQVTDAILDTATQIVKVCTPLQLLCDVIQKEMELDSTQVYLWDQKIFIPQDSRLYIAVGVLNAKPFGNTNRPDGSGLGLEADQSVNMLAQCSVDILSRGPEARDRKEEIILALQSDYAQSQQEMNSFYVAKISTSFVNLSQEDGAAIPYRFNIAINIQYFYRKIKGVPYYDDFDPVEVTTEP